MVEWENSGIAYAFWKRVLDYANRKCRETWPFGGPSQDRKCPHCKTWASTVGGFSTTPEPDGGWSDTMHCKHCGRSSPWRMEGGGFVISLLDHPGWDRPRPPQKPVKIKDVGKWMS
jgi:hypothetical protein